MEQNDLNNELNIENQTTVNDEIQVESYQPMQEQKEKFEYKTNGLAFHLVSIACLIMASFFFVFQIYLTPISVYGLSMYPTINYSAGESDDRSHTDMVYYRKKDNYTYGDIVIFSNEDEQYITNTTDSKPVNFLIKRVIACPGDTITFFLTQDENWTTGLYFYDIEVTNRSGEIIELNEQSYINEEMYVSRFSSSSSLGKFSSIAEVFFDKSLSDSEKRVSIKLSDGCYYVMGDNRNNSSDSRYFGEINQDDICGNVRLHVKDGENIFNAIFDKIQSYFTSSYITIKENL